MNQCCRPRQGEVLAQKRSNFSRHFVALALSSMLAGCAYRRSMPVLPSQQKLKVIAKAPQTYVFRLQLSGDLREFKTEPDGQVTLDVPRYGGGCSVYLFDKVKMPGSADSFRRKSIDVLVGGKVARRLSLKDISLLPTGSDGIHVLIIREGQKRHHP